MLNTQKLLVGGLILMVILNLCTLGFILFRPHYDGFGDKHGHHPGKWEPNKGPFSELNLTSEQEEVMKQLKSNLDVKMDSLRDKADELREAQFQLLKNENSNLELANTQAEQIGKCFSEMEKLMFEHFTDIKKILTHEQQTEFYKFTEQMSKRRMGPPLSFMHGHDNHHCGPNKMSSF